MSGPKTAHYTLTPEQRKLLIEQTQRRRQYSILTRQQQDARSIVAQTDAAIEKFAPLLQEAGREAQEIEQVKALHNEIMSSLDLASKLTEASGLSTLQQVGEKITKDTRKLRELSEALERNYETINSEFRTNLAKTLALGFSQSFANLGEEEPTKRNLYYKKITDALGSVSHLAALPSDKQERFHAIIEQAEEIDDSSFMKNFYAMTVLPFVKECQNFHENYMKFGDEYERKRLVYEENARELGMIPEKIPFSDHALDTLEDKIRETNIAIQERNEQAYISRCVDEALQEMGYSVLGSRDIVKRNGKKFHNELYLFNEGTAVNVTYSSDGQITMELGGIGTENRIPTKSESISLVSDMCAFCDDYSDIEKVLRKKGILTKKISVLPPEPQFAQIINVSDYDLHTNVAEYEERTEKRLAEKRKARRIGE